MNKMDDLERFDDDTNTIETMTELTGVTGDTGFSSTTSNAPTSESDFTTMPTEKKKSNLPKILGGVVGLFVLAGAAAVFTVSSDDNNVKKETIETQVSSEQTEKTPNIENQEQAASEENNETTVVNTEQQIPSLDNTVQSTSNPTDSENTVTQNVETTVVKSEPTNALNQNQTDFKNNSLENSTIKTSDNLQPNNLNNTMIQSQQILPQEQNVPAIVNTETVNTQQEMNDVNLNTNLNSEKLRSEAKKMLEQADALDKGNIDSLLIGKTPNEQIAILKQRLENVQLELSKKQVCKNTEKKNSHFSKKNVKHKKQNKKSIIQESKYNVTGIVEGQIWVKNGNNSKSYVVGDKLPNGSRIKSIDFDSKTIVTERGTFKVN